MNEFLIYRSSMIFQLAFLLLFLPADETKMESDNGNGNGIYPDEYCGLYEF